MKKLNKFVAGLSAIAMTAAMMTTVSAATIPGVHSNFSYELVANAVSDTQVEVTFQVKNNPGLSSLGVALQFDDTCEPVDADADVKNCVEACSYNPDMDLIFYAVGAKPDIMDPTKFVENTENFSITFLFDVGTEGFSSLQFSLAVTGYHSEAEKINYDNSIDEMGYTPETTIETYPYLLGDMDNDGKIRVEDANAAYSISNVHNAVYGNPAAPVNLVNYNVEHNVISTTMGGENTIPWGTRFSYLMRSGYSYAETVDVDRNGYIEEADGDEILQYYANHAVSLPMETLIGTTQVKTVTVSS